MFKISRWSPRQLAVALSALVVTSCADAPAGSPLEPVHGAFANTAGSGLSSTPGVRGNLGAFKVETEYQGFDVEIKTRKDADLITTTVIGGPGSHSGWHYHPGPALLIVRRGTLTSYVVENGDCTKTVYHAGSAYFEGTAPHIVVNEGAETIELSVVFIAPRGAPARIDSPDPGAC